VTIDVGAHLGSYQVTALIGEGGMGRVFRAHDTKLKRDVAIKVLPDLFAHDPERLARFEREAHVLASLNHSNIAHVYGFEESAGVRALVMELVEGPTLAERIGGHGPHAMALDEALPIARQIADALDAAHEQGIVYRDLKPANVKLRPDGVVKVLDFGLAKALDPTSSASRDAANSPTMTARATQLGMILGTAAYMAPEQAKGKTVDKRADIWAFGAVLYEMLTGRRPFASDDISETLAFVITREPDWRALSPNIPAPLVTLVRRCLEKDPKRRLRDIGDARIAIEEAGSESEPEAAKPSAAPRSRLAWSVAAVLAVIAAGAVAWEFRPVPPPPEVRLEITTPPTNDIGSMAVSPDGRFVVFVGDSEKRLPQLWLRPLDTTSPRPLEGTDGAAYPFWSPDSRSIGFFADNRLKRIDIVGGAPQTLANVPAGRGGTWNADDVIVFAGTNTELFRVPAGGGKPVAITRVDTPRQANHRAPQFLPDGRHFVFYAVGTPEGRGVYVGSLDTPGTTRLFDAQSAAVFRRGHLLFLRQGTLFAQRFDPDRLELASDPFPVAEQVAQDTISNMPAISTSVAGPLAYRTGSLGSRQLIWFDRSGKPTRAADVVDERSPTNLALSPDGGRVAFDRRETDGNTDIWLLDLNRGVRTRFTSDANIDLAPLWSPDGSRIVFSSNRDGIVDLYEKRLSGGSEARLFESRMERRPQDWARDGRFLLYRMLDSKTGMDLWVLPFEEGKKPFPAVQTEFDENHGQFSPDGKWIAYGSNVSGRYEIYVRQFPPSGGDVRISTDGGAQARWGPGGRELFYIGLDGRLMAVPIRVDGAVLVPGSPTALFATRIAGGATFGNQLHQYAVAADGQRFLINSYTEEAATAPITVILNWKGNR
jgi:serine/threonine protein kinase/Tol biopolymer transport system component